jgi:hypothetical protein
MNLREGSLEIRSVFGISTQAEEEDRKSCRLKPADEF